MDDDALPRRTPEEQGVASSGLLALVDALEAVDEVHSLMVVTRGAVVAEGWWDPYTPDRPHQLFSLTKTFTAIAVGLAEAEGLLSPDDLVLDHVSLEGAAPHPNLERMRLEHLLTMTTGHHEDTSDRVFEQEDWVQAFLRLPVEHEPGTHFAYNTAATHVLAAVVQGVTGERVIDYLGPRLLEPLGITGATTEQSPTGVDTGGFGMSARTEDVARLGVLLLDDGRWRGRRILPEGWVAAASRARTPSTGENPDWQQGYGYQMWRGRHGSFRGDGAFGQFCVVLPEQETVVAITAGTQDMQGVLDALWAHLLPAVAAAPLPADDDAHRRLAERLAALRHEPPLG
ncbi:serine hydrolase, partial [Actinotalea ferrariae]|uniref:serine hydrolase domain-containing protein n=1 Tax=Actinotalea ferrariae TaxID=1386098 RepID=UPI001C8CA6A7